MSKPSLTPTAAALRLNSPRRAIGCMLAGTALLSLSAGFTKIATATLPTGEVLFIRSAFILLPLTVMIARAGGMGALTITDYRSQILRALFMAVGTYAFVAGLGLLPLAVAISIVFAGPLFVSALAPLLLGEVVRWRRGLAVIVGFIGILVITKPTGEGLNWAVLLPLTAAFLAALRDIITRHMSATESSVSILFYGVIALLIGGFASAPFGWRVPDLATLSLLATSGIGHGIGLFTVIESFRWGEAALVIPFKYTMLLWATLYGFLFWGELPAANVVLGAVIIFVSSLYIFHREIVVSRGKREGEEA